jgi:glycosyltransferase involved in cell wall biosynthesis
VALIFLLALVLRLGFAVWAGTGFERKIHFYDTNRFRRNADHLLEGRIAEITDVPGYPAFLALHRLLRGRGELPETAVRITQCFLGALGAVFLVWVGRSAFSTETGLLSALFFAIYPFIIFYSCVLLSEALFIPLFVLLFLFLWRAGERFLHGVLAGLLMGALILIRPSFLLFPLFLLPFWWFLHRRRGYRAVLHYTATLLITTLILIPWWIRNIRTYGHFVPTTITAGTSLFEGNSEFATGGPAQQYVKWPDAGMDLAPYERDRLRRKKAIEYIRVHPGRFARLALEKFRRLWNPLPNFGGFRRPHYMLASLLSYVPVMILGILGFIRLRGNWRKLLFLLSPVIYFTLLHMVFIGSTRYRTPVMPFIMIIGAAGICEPATRGKKRRWRSVSSPLLTVIMPILNEEKTLEVIIRKVADVELDKEIVAVDDGSTDSSPEILDRLSKDFACLRVIRHERNQGKGAAVRTALEAARGDIVIIQDADLEYDPRDYGAVIEPIVHGDVLVCYGSRILGGGGARSYHRYYWGGRLVTLFTNLFYGLGITDEPTCYKAFRTEVLKSMRLEERGFGFCPEVTAQAARMGLQIGEVPISYYPRSIEEGKKIRWQDGLEALWILVKYRFFFKPRREFLNRLTRKAEAGKSETAKPDIPESKKPEKRDDP